MCELRLGPWAAVPLRAGAADGLRVGAWAVDSRRARADEAGIMGELRLGAWAAVPLREGAKGVGAMGGWVPWRIRSESGLVDFEVDRYSATRNGNDAFPCWSQTVQCRHYVAREGARSSSPPCVLTWTVKQQHMQLYSKEIAKKSKLRYRTRTRFIIE